MSLDWRFDPAGHESTTKRPEGCSDRQRPPFENHLIRVPGGAAILRMVEVEGGPISFDDSPSNINRISPHRQSGCDAPRGNIIVDTDRRGPTVISCRSAEDDRSPSRRWVDPDKAGPDTRTGSQLVRSRIPTLPVFGEIDVGRTPVPAAVGALKQMDALFSAGISIGNSQVQVPVVRLP